MNLLKNSTLKKYFLASVIGSSLYATAITFAYTGNAYRKSNRPKDVPYEMFELVIPVFFALMNVINVYLQSTLGKYMKFKEKNYVIATAVGGMTGLAFSLLGRFGLDLPRKIFNFPKDKEWIVHVVAPFLYAAIFALIIQPINEYLLYN